MATDNIFQSLSNQNRSDVVENKEKNFCERSVLPLGRSRITTINEGYILPVEQFATLPGDSIDIDFSAFLEVLNPFIERQYSGMKLCFHTFFNKNEHAWKGWKAFSTRGHRGNISLTLPYVDVEDLVPLNVAGFGLKNNSSDSVPNIYTVHDIPFSLASSLTGITFHHIYNQSLPTNYDAGTKLTLTDYGMGDNTQVNRSFRTRGLNSIDPGETSPMLVPSGLNGSMLNAIPFANYQRNFRDFYLNQNLVKDNPYWFPDDDDDFILSYPGGKKVNMNSGTIPTGFSLVPNNFKAQSSLTLASSNRPCGDTPVLVATRCRQWLGDPFTTTVPFLERNGTTNLFTQIYALNVHQSRSLAEGVHQFNDFGTPVLPSTTNQPVYSLASSQSSISSTEYYSSPVFASGTGAPNLGLFNVLSLNQLAELSASTIWSRRNSRSKGDYNSLIEAHYGINPRSEDRMGTYLGGACMRLEFDSVVQQSSTSYTLPDSSTGFTPLGSVTSRASAGGRASIKHFECTDFGYISIYASLVPDTFYSQGLRPEFDAELTGVELPWPEFANLDKEPVLLKRLFYSGDSTYDTRLIGYQERFLDWKYRPNQVCCHLSDYLDSKFRAMTFARFFSYQQAQGIQSINNEFVTLSPYNCRSDMYSVPSQPHFILQFGDSIRCVRALPYAVKDVSLTNVA